MLIDIRVPFSGSEDPMMTCVSIFVPCSLPQLGVVDSWDGIGNFHCCRGGEDHRVWAFPCWLWALGQDPLYLQKVNRLELVGRLTYGQDHGLLGHLMNRLWA